MDLALLDQIKEYIEAREMTIEHEWRGFRTLKELIKSDDMPELYSEILIEIDKFNGENNDTNPMA